MTALSHIQSMILDTTAAIARLERVVSLSSPPSLIANIDSLRARQRVLEDEFIDVSAQAGTDVCSYRLSFDGERPPVATVSRSLATFQSLFSVVYDALKNGPKRTAHLSAETVARTTFGFGYTFPGSLGVVMTLPNDPWLFGDTPVDLAMKLVLAMLKAETTTQLSEFSRTLGAAPVRAVYQWASSHARTDMSASIEWRHAREVRARALIQEPEVRRLQQTLDAMGDEHCEEVVVNGVLVAVDVPRSTFRMSVTSGGDIRGTFAPDVIGLDQTAEVPRRYRAALTKRTRVRFSMEKEEVSWTLNRLDALS